MKRTKGASSPDWAIRELAEYIVSRRDLDDATPREIEAALKKAGWLFRGDHSYTAYQVELMARSIRRAPQEAASPKRETNFGEKARAFLGLTGVTAAEGE